MSKILYGLWNSSDKTVATVTSKGIVRGLKPGKAVITLLYIHGDIPYDATINVNVVESVTGLSFSDQVRNLKMGESCQLSYSLIPSTAYNEDLEWKSSNTKVATVSSRGKIITTGVGETDVTVTTKYSKHSAICKIIVSGMAEDLILNPESITISVSESQSIKSTVLPENILCKKVTWQSSDSTIAKVTNGKVTGVKVGEVDIIAKTVDSGIEKKCHVKVVNSIPVERIVIKEKEVSIYAGEQYEVSYEIYPSNATNQEVIIKVSKPVDSNQDIITVKNNVITGIRQGTSIITVESKVDKVNDIAIINVVPYVTGITINKKTESMYVGEPNKKLAATILPESDTFRPVTWESSNSSIINVNSKGVLKALKSGKATITATSVDGNFKDSCEVTASNMITDIFFEVSSFKLGIDSFYTPKYTINPLTAYEKGVTFLVEDNNIATVDRYGKVRGRNVGETKLIAITKDGGFQASCKINVIYNVLGITIYDNEGIAVSEIPSESDTLEPTPIKTVTPKPVPTLEITITPRIIATPKPIITKTLIPTKTPTKTPISTKAVKPTITPKITPNNTFNIVLKFTFEPTTTKTPIVTPNMIPLIPNNSKPKLEPRNPQDPILIMVDGKYVPCDVNPIY